LIGVILASAAQISVWLLTKDDAEKLQETYLVVSDRQELMEGESLPAKEIVEVNPQVLRECDIKKFIVWDSNRIPDGPGVTSGFVVREQSNENLNCVLSAIEDRKIFGWFASANHPNELSPIVLEFQEQIAAEEHAQTH
jgi:hypothetical protein